ncbi:LOW QUALITY PROTEIN: pre-mRNA-processing protein 40A-like [Capsicum annuum]|uniref:LOW QUALITY PROTEIN: pre-mRNA-processing protein 40A-like n=1 Tax=Capsicum annuum TaxID=4072 RepID=UPI001FB08CAF|nr:LOW QUALITY PROTEIN: pre-mRNA-processing protein 40A-like [Capsicum annuum]
MAFKVSSMLRNQVVERASAKEEASILQVELDSRTRRLETKKNELQSEKVKELKSETLLTTILREKLYSEEMDIKQLQADLAGIVRVHQNSTCGATKNIGTAAKPNGIIHGPVRADRPNAFSNNSSSILSCKQIAVDILSQTAGSSMFELLDHALVGPGREGGVRILGLSNVQDLFFTQLTIFSYIGNGQSSCREFFQPEGDQINDHRFPSGVQPWMPISIHNVNSATTMQKTGDLAAPLVVPVRIQCVLLYPFYINIVNKYYYNIRTKISTWEKPLELMKEMERADTSTNWREFTSPEGRKYYYNKVTRTSKWRMPDEVKLDSEKNTISHVSDFGSISVVKTLSPDVDGSLVSAHGAKSSSTTVSPAANLPTIVASESSSLYGKVSSPMIEIVEIKNSSEPASPGDTNSEKIGIAVTLGNSVAPPIFETTTTQDAVVYGDRFSSENRELLCWMLIQQFCSAVVSNLLTGEEYAPTSNEAMRAVINDRRYGALKSLSEPKQAFNDNKWYFSQQCPFFSILQDCKKLSPSSRWSKAISIFKHDECFKFIERAKDHEDLFEDYVEELEKKEHAKALEKQKRNRVEYLEFLKSCDFIKIFASSQWRKVQDRLETNKRCSHLEKIDRLEIFQEYIRDLESEEEEQRKLRMEELRKVEHKNSDEFRKLMEEHVAAGILNAKTNWRDYCIKIKDFAAYLVVSSNTPGSIVKDLFTDIMDELKKQYLDDKSQIKDAVRMAEIGLKSTWTLDDFKVAITKYVSSPPMSDTNLKFVFEELLERAREKEEKEAKKRKCLADEFYEILHALKEITASSKWDDCKSLFGDRIMGDEGLLLEIFNKFVNELKEKECKRQED